MNVRDGEPICVSWTVYRLMCNAWGLSIGFAAMVGALLFYLLPPDVLGRTAVSEQFGGLDEVWNLGYGIGGLLIVVGLIRDNRPTDVLGLSLLGAAILVNSVAIFATYGTAALSTAPTLIALGAACIARILVVAEVVEPKSGRPRSKT